MISSFRRRSVLATIARIASKSKFMESESIIKILLRDYVIPFYLRRIGGKIHTNDYVIFVDERDRKAVMNFIHSILYGKIDIESYEVEVFSTLVANYPDAIVFDLGANYGMYTLAACFIRKHTHSMSVIAVEPDSRVFACLNKSLTFNNWQMLCHLVNGAAGSRHNDNCNLVRHNKQSSFNFTLPLSSAQCPAGYEITDSVKVLTVDGLVKDLKLTPKKIIVKIDIEGNEIQAIEGMKETLQSCAGYAVFCEYSVNRMNIAGNRPESLLEQIFSLGQDGVYEIDPNRKSVVRIKRSVELLQEDRRYCNLLIVKNMDMDIASAS
jgi:FkbM family methyltransferase